MFGMAHRDGSLSRIHKVLLGVLALAALAGGAVWTKLHVPDLDIDEVPLSAALISAGAVILLLSASPLMAWLDRIPVLRGLLGLITGRALTVYLLYPIAIAATSLVAARLGIGSDPRTLIFTTVGLAVVGVLAFGWVEDLAARRPLGLYPRSRKKKRKAKSFEGRASVPQVAPMPSAISVPVSVPQQVRPLQPVLEGAGGPPRAAVHASGPLQAVGGRPSGPNAIGARPSIPPQMGPGPGQPDRQHASPPQSWPPAPLHRAGPAHPGLQHSGPQPGLPQGPHPVSQHPGPAEPGRQHGGQPAFPQYREPQRPGPSHSGPQHPVSQHPAPQHPGSHPGLQRPGSRPMPQHPGMQHSGPQAGLPYAGPHHHGPDHRGPQQPGVQHSGPQQPVPGPKPPPRQQSPPPPPPAKRSGRPR
jgi:hypothetical protein